MDSKPRPEYPRPDFVRSKWLNLNGKWTVHLDKSQSGYDRGCFNATGFDETILVPFCPESSLSGIGHRDFIPMIWYHNSVTIPESWHNRQIVLHFGAVYYECEVFIDGTSIGTHSGGSIPFTFDITDRVSIGTRHNIVIVVRSDLKSNTQPAGKQSQKYHSHTCHYTRCTGIWQTVWLEPIHKYGLKECEIVPDVDNAVLILQPHQYRYKNGYSISIIVRDENRIVTKQKRLMSPGCSIELNIPHPVKLWSPDSPFLYDIDLCVTDQDNRTIDRVSTYAGMRKVHIEGNQIFLNNTPLYTRFVLDQRYYPDGIWTAPSDRAIKQDIELGLKAGFNGARLHQKACDPRFHFWADRLGYLTWAEGPSWGLDLKKSEARENFHHEWEALVKRDKNHPSIIAWTPFNESRHYGDKTTHDCAIVKAFHITKVLDKTRPVNDTSGFTHVVPEIWTSHCYDTAPSALYEKLKSKNPEKILRNFPDLEPPYKGEPYILDEWGGVRLLPDNETHNNPEKSWGYGTGMATEDTFYRWLEQMMDVLVAHDHICGHCYTQLTDVEQEKNGIYNFDRTEKFDMKKINHQFSRVPRKYNLKVSSCSEKTSVLG